MTKIVLPTLMLAWMASSAQFSKGEKFLDGSFNINTQNNNSSDYVSSKGKSFSIYSRMGFFVSEKFAIGGGLGFGISKQTYNYKYSSTRIFRQRLFSKPIFSAIFYNL